MDHEVLVIGHSLLPKGTATRTTHDVLSIVAVVDRNTNCIREASVTLTTETSQRWVAAQLKDQNVLAEPSPFVESMEKRYWGPAQRAIVQCFRDLQKRYEEGCNAAVSTSPT